MDEKPIKVSYNIELIRTNHHTGEIIDKSFIHNSIVDNGLEVLAKLLNGVSSTYMRAIAIGTGNTAVTTSDTELDVEVTRALATLTYEGSNVAKFYKKFTFGSGEAYTIREVGIFDSAVASGSIMFNRALDAGKSVDADTDLTVIVNITLARS